MYGFGQITNTNCLLGRVLQVKIFQKG